jgi:hypothetical protein
MKGKKKRKKTKWETDKYSSDVNATFVSFVDDWSDANKIKGNCFVLYINEIKRPCFSLYYR